MKEFIRLIKMWFAAKAEKAKWEAEKARWEAVKAELECGSWPVLNLEDRA